MRKPFFGILLACVGILAALPLLQGAQPSVQPARQPGLPPLSPMMEEIMAAVADGDGLVARLQDQLRGAADEDEALQLLRAIASQKQETEINILRIQERHARQSGDSEAADRILLVVDRILNPPVPSAPARARTESEGRRQGGGDHD